MKDAKKFAEELSDAYSTESYRGGWIGCIKMLRRRGYDDRQIEAIIRSKWTRWAGDHSSNRYGMHTSTDLAKFLDGMKNLKAEVEALTAETFAQTI